MTRTNDAALLVARLALAALFLPSESRSFQISAASLRCWPGRGAVSGLARALGAAAETVGPVALILGVAPRLTAVLLIGFTVVASLLSHSFWTFSDLSQATQQRTQFLKNMAIVGGLLFYFVSGAGGFSLPGILRGRPSREGAPARA